MTIFYHITPTKNVSKILKIGLLPSIGDRSNKIETQAGIYLFNSIDDVKNALENWMADEFDEEERLALLQISLDNYSHTPNHYETVINEIIPAKQIKIITRDVDTYFMNENVTVTYIEFISNEKYK